MDAAHDGPCRYRITVHGELGDSFAPYLEAGDGSVEVLRSESVLIVQLANPRALGQVLDALYGLRLPLTSVELLCTEC